MRSFGAQNTEWAPVAAHLRHSLGTTGDQRPSNAPGHPSRHRTRPNTPLTGPSHTGRRNPYPTPTPTLVPAYVFTRL